MGLAIFDEHNPVLPTAAITDGDTTVPVYVTQGANAGTRIDGLVITSTSVTPRQVSIVLDNGTPRVLGTVAVPAGAGQSSAVPSVDASSVFPTVPGALVVPGGTALKASVTVTLGAGEEIDVFAFGGEF